MRLTKYYQSAFTVATSTGSSVAVDPGSEMPAEMIQGLGTLAGVVSVTNTLTICTSTICGSAPAEGFENYGR